MTVNAPPEGGACGGDAPGAELDSVFVGRDPVDPGTIAVDPGEIEIDPEYFAGDSVDEMMASVVADPMPMEDPAAVSYDSGESSFGYDDADSYESTDQYAADADDSGSW